MLRSWTGLLAGVVLAASFASVAGAADKVAIGYIGGTADVGFYIADARGYLKQEGIEATFTIFDSDVKMIPSLATGDLDVASGMLNAATYNAAARGITLRAVADKARNKGEFSYQGLVVRKDLVDSGKFTSLKDLKGRKFGLTGQAGNSFAVMVDALRSVGLSKDDVEVVYLSLPQQAVAFASGAIDVSFLPEPFLSKALQSGSAVNFLPVTKIRDDDVTGVITYGERFIKDRPDVAKKMTKAYIRGLRDYSDSLQNGRIAGPGADDIIDIISRYSSVKDKALLRQIIPHYVDPDGKLGIESLEQDWAFYKSEGIISGEVTVGSIVDTSLVEAAIRELGPYRRRVN
jgi:NitT/TauT family transport system substrate-binding protein